MQTRDQRYATHIYQQVQAISQIEDKNAKSYGVMAHKLPILIHSAGLVQALFFVASREENKAMLTLFLNDLADTVKQKNGEQLLLSAQKATLGEYIYLTQCILDALLWYKRFAQSLLDIDTTDSMDQGEPLT
jgi:CRISPR-associated protein Cmr5